jgi:hypothetical protein
MVDWFYNLPINTLAIWVAVLFVGYCWVGGILVRPFARLFVRSRKGENEIIGNILSSFGIFYGLLLGLIAVAAYQNFARVEANVAKEVASLETLYQDVSIFPEPHGQNLRWLLRDYTRYVIKYGWPEYRKGRIPKGGATRIEAFHERMLAFEPQTKTEELVFAEALRQFNVFLEHQRVREQSVNTGIPPIMWYVVIVGAVLYIGLIWLFDMRFLTLMFLGGVLSFFLGAMILLIAVMDNPFRGAVSISPEPFEQLYWSKMRD